MIQIKLNNAGSCTSERQAFEVRPQLSVAEILVYSGDTPSSPRDSCISNHLWDICSVRIQFNTINKLEDNHTYPFDNFVLSRRRSVNLLLLLCASAKGDLDFLRATHIEPRE